MDLWIRSQDKERLIQVENLYIEFNGDTTPKIDSHRIVTDKFINLGIYKSKERALEVLDEIQNHLLKMGDNEILTDKIGIMNGIKHYGIVYEMPKE